MKKLLLLCLCLLLSFQSVIAKTDYNPTLKDIKIITSINDKVDIIIQKKGLDTGHKLLDKLLDLRLKAAHNPRLLYILDEIIINIGSQVYSQERNYVDTSDESISFTIKVYEDIRCTSCNSDYIIESLKGVPGLANASFIRADFSDDGISDYLKKSNITTLPAFIFPTNFVDPGIKTHLQSIGGGEYSLNVGSEFNPFLKKSGKGYLVLKASDLILLQEETVYTRGNEDADIVWFEYTNFVCSACERFYKSGIHDTVLKKHGDEIKYASKHFHFELHGSDPYPTAEVTECAAEQLGSEGFYALEKNVLIDDIKDVDILIQKTVALGANKAKLESCISSNRTITTLDSVKENGIRIFGIDATPTNILVNLKTGEYMKTQNIASDLEIFMGK
ncbi:MAG: thioredoxin domain-containing protein [Candidatus Gracilibacteria bacterium]|nr:thioredoxin domain-containing protein [Candidatus Gracilibacteria bacterium]